MASEDTVTAGIDTTSPSTLERRNSLEKHLQSRPNEQELKDRHILLDTKAAPYVSSFPSHFPLQTSLRGFVGSFLPSV